MTDKKATTHRKVPAITEAPPPINPINTGGYRRKKDQLADYQHWNRMPVINLRQTIMLTLGIEPALKIYEPPNRQRYVQLEQVALSHRQAGTLPVCAHNPDLIRSDDWLQWIRSKSDEEPPKEWQPIGLDNHNQDGESGHIDDHLEDNIHTRRRDEVLGAAVEMLEFLVPIDQQTVLNFMRKNSDKYPACFQRTVEDKTLIRSITRAGGDVFDDRRYLDALASTDRTDSADKG